MIASSTPYKDTNGMRPAIASINIANLRHNYRLLDSRTEEAEIMAVVKANAYGHGLELVAPALFEEGCRHFAVTDASEGARTRSLVPEADSIVLLSGIFDSSDADLACRHRLTPVVIHEDQVKLLQQAGFTGLVWIKVNTGMQRLGADTPEELIELCRSHGIKLAGIMSHLACADTPEHPLNRAQAEEFSSLHQQLAPQSAASLLNSAGIATMPEHGFRFVRPGLALYGAEPVPAEPMGVRPVMQLTGQVIQVRQVSEGASLSYGASYTATDDMSVAIVSLGYGDGLPRLLSNRGFAVYRGERLPIVGRVCMDFCLLDCSQTALQPGDTVEFWGETLRASDIADSIDTIAYELFTGINARVQRRETA